MGARTNGRKIHGEDKRPRGWALKKEQNEDHRNGWSGKGGGCGLAAHGAERTLSMVKGRGTLRSDGSSFRKWGSGEERDGPGMVG